MGHVRSAEGAGERQLDARGRWIARLSTIGVAANGVGVALLLTFLVGSLILTGGQVAPDGNPAYPAFVEWPPFHVPAWVSTTIATVGLLGFVPMAALVRPTESARLVSAFTLTIAGSCLQSLVMMLVFPTVIPHATNPVLDRTVPGEHWVGLALGGLTIVLILALGGRAMTAHDRLRRGTPGPPT